jgi:hypothetical protein
LDVLIFFLFIFMLPPAALLHSRATRTGGNPPRAAVLGALLGLGIFALLIALFFFWFAQNYVA